ncbi:MAG: polysaccharide deacetylase family protein, partial [bacterium]
KILRFLTIAFVTGAFIGLVCGLAFGGASGTSTPKAIAQTDKDKQDQTAASPASSAPAEPMTPERAQTIGANEMGQVLVLMYHLIDSEESEWTRTPDNFRKDIDLLRSEGFYPINVRDLASGNIDIPAGKSPVVITFDDSSPGQFRILDDGTVDPDSAVGILQEAVKSGDWAPRASFYCLLDVVPKERVLFGQPDRQQEKLRYLVEGGYEIGSHTVTHLNLKEATVDESTKQLAQSQATLERLIGGGYSVTNIALPFGAYPADDSILAGGEYDETKYAYTAGLSLGGNPSVSPFSGAFRPLHIPRIRGSADYITEAIANLKKNPELRYISDGDPTTVSAPATLAAELGELRADLGRPVVRY